jgi:hypothetical protein
VGFLVEDEGLFVGAALGAKDGRRVDMFVRFGAGVKMIIVKFGVFSHGALPLFAGAESLSPAPEIAVGMSEAKGVEIFVGTMLRVGTKLGISLSGVVRTKLGISLSGVVVARLGSKVGVVDGTSLGKDES